MKTHIFASAPASFALALLAAASIGTAAGCGSSSSDSGSKTPSEAGVTTNDDAGLPGGPVDTTPVDVASMTANTWTWVPVKGSMCRDGSATGFGINVSPTSKNLMIFLEGGGACFNALTCGMNAASFAPSSLSTATSGGILSRTDTANPVKDWNMVYVPFCTGDVHAGNAPNMVVPDAPNLGKQQFVGYANMTRYLAKLAPAFKDASKILLTGISAGGFGAAANYPQTARAFDPIPVYSLDDSGPPMEDPYAPKCLQQKWAEIWGFDKTVLADCGSDCPDPTNYTIDATIHTAKKYPNIPFGLVEDTDDGIITTFYGFGMMNCTATFGMVPGDMFTAGLLDERAKLAAAGVTNAAGFIFQGTSHTSLHTSN
ncbi:MAG: pectin acetylesterase-family hydrolase, partial [Polyangiaceae bacterium]